VIDDRERATIEDLAARDPKFAERLAKINRAAEDSGMRGRFGLRLKLLLVYRSLTQRKLAAMVGHSEGTVSRWVTGERLPEYVDLFRVAKELGVSSGYFIDDEPPELEALQRGEL